MLHTTGTNTRRQMMDIAEVVEEMIMMWLNNETQRVGGVQAEMAVTRIPGKSGLSATSAVIPRHLIPNPPHGPHTLLLPTTAEVLHIVIGAQTTVVIIPQTTGAMTGRRDMGGLTDNPTANSGRRTNDAKKVIRNGKVMLDGTPGVVIKEAPKMNQLDILLLKKAPPTIVRGSLRPVGEHRLVMTLVTTLRHSVRRIVIATATQTKTRKALKRIKTRTTSSDGTGEPTTVI